MGVCWLDKDGIWPVSKDDDFVQSFCNLIIEPGSEKIALNSFVCIAYKTLLM